MAPGHTPPLRTKLTVLVFLTVFLVLAAIVPTPAPAAGPVIDGKASYYCKPGEEGTTNCTRGYGPNDLVAAIDRKDTPWDKGDVLTVRRADREVTVLIVDTCGCPGSRLIDLTTGAFRELGTLGEGVIDITLEQAGSVGRKPLMMTLPPTDTE